MSEFSSVFSSNVNAPGTVLYFLRFWFILAKNLLIFLKISYLFRR